MEMETSDALPFERAKRLAAETHRPVYIVDGELTQTKPRRPTATAWPNGTITVGNPDAASRDIDRRLVPPAA